MLLALRNHFSINLFEVNSVMRQEYTYLLHSMGYLLPVRRPCHFFFRCCQYNKTLRGKQRFDEDINVFVAVDGDHFRDG